MKRNSPLASEFLLCRHFVFSEYVRLGTLGFPLAALCWDRLVYSVSVERGALLDILSLLLPVLFPLTAGGVCRGNLDS